MGRFAVVFLLSLAACSTATEPRRQCIISAVASGVDPATGIGFKVTQRTEVFPKLGESCAGLGGHYE